MRENRPNEYKKNLSSVSWPNRKTVSSAVKYVVVGATSLVIDAGLLYALTEQVHLNYLLSAAASFWMALVYNFLLNKFWSFGNKERDYAGQFAKYMLLIGFNFIFTLTFIFLLVEAFSVNYIISKVVSVGIITIWNFIIYKKIIFKENPK